MSFLGSFQSALAGVGGILGPSSAQQNLNNEFRDINQGQFVNPQLGGLQNRLGALGNQFGSQNALGQGAGQQQQLIGQLQNQFAGQGPGQDIARLQAQQQADRGIQQQLALQAGNRGSGAVLGARNAANNSANISGQAANQAVLGGLQAQMQAGGLLGQQLNSAQQNQLGQAQLRQQGQLQALQQQGLLAQLQQQGMNNFQNARSQRFRQIASTPTGPTPLQLGASFLTGGVGGLLPLIAGSKQKGLSAEEELAGARNVGGGFQVGEDFQGQGFTPIPGVG